MSDELVVEAKAYSPRWGTNNGYTLTFKRDSFMITSGTRSSSCDWVEKRDPIWKSDDSTLIHLFTEDSIYPPSNIIKALESIWLDWRSYELDDTQVSDEIDALFEWITITTKAKPSTDYWRKKF